MPHRPDDFRYDAYGQDTWTRPDEEFIAAEMGLPSTEPRLEHAPSTAWDDFADGEISDDDTRRCYWQNRVAVLCQQVISCGKCGRSTRQGEDVLALVDGELWHVECLENHELDGSTDH